MALFTMVELATWNLGTLPVKTLLNVANHPGDNPNRRPSDADHRNYLRYGKLELEFTAALNSQSITTQSYNPYSIDCCIRQRKI